MRYRVWIRGLGYGRILRLCKAGAIIKIAGRVQFFPRGHYVWAPERKAV